MSPLTARLPRSKGALTRQAILDEATDLASVEGLEGLSIGVLAETLGMSKSGLFAHFGSKEELQLATVAAARERFGEQVLRPALKAPRGLPRLCAVLAAWMDYGRHCIFRGGCFFAGASVEFDGRPGPVRDQVAAVLLEWRSVLVRLVREAREAGHLGPGADPDQLAFEFLALAFGANGAYQLHREDAAFDRARRAIVERLAPLAAPDASLSPLCP